MKLNKRIKKVLGILLVYSLGICMILVMCWRANQIDQTEAQKKELSTYNHENVIDNSNQ